MAGELVPGPPSPPGLQALDCQHGDACIGCNSLMRNWIEKVVLVTGGSRGLGLEIARQFGMVGAIAVIVGRDPAALESAVESLQGDLVECHAIVADVQDEVQVQRAIDQIVDKYGRLDVLVNNVGKSVRVDLKSVTAADFREYMEINFLTAVNCTRAAMPHLAESQGHVVNIGSLACKTAFPFVAPYSASKFALAAYTHQLRLEGPPGVHGMLVCPGPIKRRDSHSRYCNSAGDLPASAKLPAAGARIEGISPERLARKIIKGCEKRSREVIFPFRARILFTVMAYSPPLGDWLLRRVMRDK